MPFDAPGGDLIFMNDADQELYLVPPHLEEVFQEYSERNSESEDPLVIAKYFIPWTSIRWYATQYQDGTFRGFVTGFLYPDWEEFSIAEWRRLQPIYGKNILRDEEFTPTPFSLAIPDNEKHRQGNLIVIEDTAYAVNEVLQEPATIYQSTPAKEDIDAMPDKIDFAAEYDLLKERHEGSWHNNPAVHEELKTLWGFECNPSGVITEGLDMVSLYERKWITIEVKMAQSPKGYWKYGLRITTPTSGRGHLPSLLDPTGYTSEEVAFREALAEILEWANNEIRHASGNYQKNLEHCLIELRKYDQLDLF